MMQKLRGGLQISGVTLQPALLKTHTEARARLVRLASGADRPPGLLTVSAVYARSP